MDERAEGVLIAPTFSQRLGPVLGKPGRVQLSCHRQIPSPGHPRLEQGDPVPCASASDAEPAFLSTDADVELLRRKTAALRAAGL